MIEIAVDVALESAREPEPEHEAADPNGAYRNDGENPSTETEIGIDRSHSTEPPTTPTGDHAHA